MTDELLLEENKLMRAALERQADEIERLRAALQQIADNPYMDPEGNAEFARAAINIHKCGEK